MWLSIRPSRRTVISTAFAPTIEVKLLRLKRLVARGNGRHHLQPNGKTSCFCLRWTSHIASEPNDEGRRRCCAQHHAIILKPPLYD